MDKKFKSIKFQYVISAFMLAFNSFTLQANDIALKMLYGIQERTEKALENQIKSIYNANDTDVEKANKLLHYLITSNNYYVIQSIDFYFDVLQSNNKPPLDYTKIDFDLYYKLFHRAILKDNDAFYSHRWVMYNFLLANYEKEFTQRLLLEVKKSKTYKAKLFTYFKNRWLIPYDKKDPSFKLMLKVEEGSKYKDQKRVDGAIANRLKEIDLKHEKSSYKNDMAQLKFYFSLTLSKEKEVNWFINNVKVLTKYTSYPKSISPHVANYVTKLMIEEIKRGHYAQAKQLFYGYMDEIVPHIGLFEKSTDVASNALVLGILTKDDKISKRVISTFAKDTSEINNALLLYNMACYYASKKEKTEMLGTIKRAIKKGKNPNDFLQDSDFRQYWTDKAFLQALQ